MWFQASVQRSFPLQILLAFAVTIAAVLLRIAINYWVGETVIQYGTFYLAIVFMAWAAGQYPAWLTLGLTTFGHIYLVQSGIYRTTSTIEYLMFALISGTLILLIENLRVALNRSREREHALRRAEQQLEWALTEVDQERRRLHTVLKALPVSVFITDRDGNMLLTSDHAEQMWRRPDQPHPQRIEDYATLRGWWATGQPVQADEWALTRALEHGEVSLNQRIDVERFDGSHRAILNSAAPILDAQNNIIGGILVVIDVTAQQEAERALRESEMRYRALWDSSFNAKVIHENGVIITANQGFTKMLGYTSDDLVGKDGIALIATPEAVPIIQEHLQRRDEKPYRVRLRRRDGTEFLAEIRSRNLMLGSRDVRLSAVRDVTLEEEARQRALDLEIEKARLQTITSLIQNISHDFRTPLSTINTSVYLLERSNDPERRQEKGAVIMAQVKRLIKLVDSMLLMTRLNSGMAVERQPVELPLVLRSVEAKLKGDATAKAINWQMQVDEALPPLSADESQLEFLFTELVLNAFNHTPAGGTVELRAVAQNRQALIEVRDTGSGIERGEQARVFDPFYRVDQARGIDTGGVGLGLAIARKIVELHDGQITVESALGTGSVFRVLLPLPLPVLP